MLTAATTAGEAGNRHNTVGGLGCCSPLLYAHSKNVITRLWSVLYILVTLMMQSKYYIPDENGNAKEVTQKEHSAWATSNAAKYNQEWKRDDGTKILSLTFFGLQDSFGDIELFKVRNIFKDYEGNIVTNYVVGFDTYDEALESFDTNVAMNS